MYGSDGVGKAAYDLGAVAQAKRETEIGAVVGRLVRAAEVLEGETENINSSVASVLGSATPVTGSNCEAKDLPPACDLAERLLSIARRIENATNYLRSTRERVEL